MYLYDMAQANQHEAPTGLLWIWLLMSVHDHFLPSIDHISAHYTLHNSIFIVLKVLWIQVHYVIHSPGVSTLIPMELRAGEVIEHLLVTVHLVSHDSTRFC